jgi:hypothetical protein
VTLELAPAVWSGLPVRALAESRAVPLARQVVPVLDWAVRLGAPGQLGQPVLRGRARAES